MSYELVHTNNHGFLDTPSTKSGWSPIGAHQGSHTYTPLDSPYDHPQKQSKLSPVPSIISVDQQSEIFAPYSSRTALRSPEVNHEYLHPNRVIDTTGEPWHPGFWARFPWLGMSALLLTIVATLACIVVLISSQGVPIDKWGGRFQPTVYLSIFTAMANITLTYALYEGMVISFWYRAHRGTTLQELHQYWQSGSSLWGAFQGIFQFRGKTTAIACILTVFSIGRGPLLQRASLVRNSAFLYTGSLNISSASSLPVGYAGSNTAWAMAASYMNPSFTDIVQSYVSRDDIAGTWSGCDATCHATVKGFGFRTQCETSEIPYKLDFVSDRNSSNITQSVPIFAVDIVPVGVHGNKNNSTEITHNYLRLNTTLRGGLNSVGNRPLIQHICQLHGGIVSYPFKISNNTLTLQSNDWHNDTFLEEISLDNFPKDGGVSNIGGFFVAARGLYHGKADIRWAGGSRNWTIAIDGMSPNRYLRRPDPPSNLYDLNLNVSFRDPMDDIINSMREIAFRTSLHIAATAAADTPSNTSQTVPFTGEKPETIYTASYAYMLCGAAVSLLGVLAVIPTYWGFWQLGRAVSLSPLEIAKAFGAPLLSGVPGNRPAHEILDRLEHTKFRYGDAGVVHDVGAPSQLLLRKMEIGPASRVRLPQSGVRYI